MGIIIVVVLWVLKELNAHKALRTGLEAEIELSVKYYISCQGTHRK